MTRTDLATALGSGVRCVKYTIAYSDFTTAGTTQTLPLLENPGCQGVNPATNVVATMTANNFQIPSGGYILAVRFKHTEAFVGAVGPVSSVTLTLQKVGSTNFATPGTLVSSNLCAAVADTTLTEFTGFKMSTHATIGLCVLATSIGGNVNACTAGSADIYVYWLDISSSG